MIEYDDFVKLFVIFNADMPDVIDKGHTLAHELHEKGYFDSKTQVIPNDFLTGLENIRKEIEKLWQRL